MGLDLSVDLGRGVFGKDKRSRLGIRLGIGFGVRDRVGVVVVRVSVG